MAPWIVAVGLGISALGLQGTPEPAGTRRALIVCGLPGDDEHRESYAEVVEKIFGGADRDVRFRGGRGARAIRRARRPRETARVRFARGIADRAGIEADVAELRRRLRPEDTLWVIVLGHGHYDGRHSYLNISGPDMDEREVRPAVPGFVRGSRCSS